MEEIIFVDSWETENTKPLEELTPIFIHHDFLDRHIMIEIELTEELRSALVELLKKTTMCLHGRKAMS